MWITNFSKFIEQNSMSVALLIIVALAIVVLLVIQHRNDNFDLRWVIADEQTKQPSLHKVGQLTALVMSTWLLVYLTLHDKMDGTYFGTYMAIWAGAQVANKWLTTRDSGKTDQTAPTDPTSDGDPKDWTRQ